MTCTQVRLQLPLLAYDDLPPDEADAIHRHLADCPACQGEYAGLVQVRRALDAVPVPPVAVDVNKLFAQTAARQVRRWRRLALAGAALAAGLLLVFVMKLHVRAGNGQFVIAWGPSTEAPVPGPQPSVPAPVLMPPDPVAIPASVEERLQLLQELTHALAAEIDARDRRRQQDADLLRARFDVFQRAVVQRWEEADRTFKALYVAQFKRPEEGTNR